nr:class D beta-lactamase [Ciceribacter sp. L1K22]
MVLRRKFVVALGMAAFGAFSLPSVVSAKDIIHCTVIADLDSGDVLHREGTCDKGFYPQSTFKLPLAMMGYDAGILIDEKTPRWDYKPEFKRSKREQKSVDPTIWEKDSIVWYSQEITRKLGENRFADYVQRFGYGNRNVSGGPSSDGLTESWLMSSLLISPDQQVDFLRRFLTGALPISDAAFDYTQAITPRFEAKDGWTVKGKTGSGWLRDKAGKTNRNRPLGWFVGWAERDGQTLVFARMRVADRPQEEPISFATRDSLIADLPKLAEDF